MEVTAVRSALPQKPAPSPVAKTAADSLLQRQIALLLFRRDSKNPRAILEDLDETSRGKYLDAAIMAIRQVDDTFHVPALYAAVDAGDRFESGDGIATMHKDVRIHELGRFETALRAYRKSLSAESPTHAELFRKLAEADRQPIGA